MIVRAEARTYLRDNRKGKGKDNGNGKGNGKGKGKDKGNGKGKGKDNGKNKGNGKDKDSKGNGDSGSDVGRRIQAGCIGFRRMDIGIVRVSLTDRITQNVLELISEVFVIRDTVGVVAFLPDRAVDVLSYCK
jgi:hypothetical protein